MKQPMLSKSLTALPLGIAAFCINQSYAHADGPGCHESKICVEIPVRADDREAGHYIFPTKRVKARGTRVQLITPDTAMEILTDDDGCFTFTSRHTRGFKLLVYPEALLGVAQNVHITAVPHAVTNNDPNLFPWPHDINSEIPPDNHNSPMSIMPDPVAYFDYGYDYKNLGEGRKSLEFEQPDPDMLNNSFGWTIEAFHNIDRDVGITGPRLLHVNGEMGDGAWRLGAFARRRSLMLGRRARHRKFIVAHEVGHWYQMNWTDLDPRVNYSYEDDDGPDFDFDTKHSKDDPCDFWHAVNVNVMNDQHGIRSAEFASEAMSEGFAQFMAALAFNDPEQSGAQYQYYKEIINKPVYKDFVSEDNYYVDMIGSANGLGGPLAWVPIMCTADWDSPKTENGHEHVSTEIDWMRFFWGFIADPDSSLPDSDPNNRPTLRTILEIFKAANTLRSNNIYASFQDAIDNSQNAEIYPYRARFAAVAQKNGVQTND